MFPDVVAEDGLAALGLGHHVHQRIVLVGGRRDHQAPVGPDDEPDPAGTELAAPGGLEGRLHLLHRAEVARDRSGKRGRGAAAPAGRRHQAPEKLVVEMPAAIVAHGLGKAGDTRQHLPEGQPPERRVGRNGTVEIVHIGAVVGAMVEAHRLGIDHGDERVLRIGQRRKGKGRSRGGRGRPLGGQRGRRGHRRKERRKKGDQPRRGHGSLRHRLRPWPAKMTG